MSNLKHGGEGAVKAIHDGRDFIGLAHETELAIREELETQGRYEILTRNAVRVQTAADLYWNAVQKAAEDGDLLGFDHYLARYGWLIGVVGRAWQQVASEKPSDAIDLGEEMRKIADKRAELKAQQKESEANDGSSE